MVGRKRLISVAETIIENTNGLAEPAPVYNCPQCSHYLQPGTLACPECGAMVYAAHLRDLAIRATTEENGQHWTEAHEVWREALRWVEPGTKQALAVEQRMELIDTRLRGIADWKTKWSKRLGPLAPAFFFLAKVKSVFFLLLKAKFLLSFIGFFAIYWAIWGWKFGLGFAVAILIHEMGHYVAAKRRGLQVDLPVFLPGLGAYVRWYSQGISLDALSGIALAGPFFGLLAAIVCGGLALATGNPLFSALAHVGAWINLVNLTPVLGLDGAQATYSLDRTQRWLVLATSLIFFGVLREGPFAFVAVGMVWRLWQGAPAERPSTKTLVQYVLLLFVLGVVIYLFPDTRRFGAI